MKRVIVMIVRGIAAIAAVVCGFCPLSTWTTVLVFVTSIAILLLCQIAVSSLDETLIDDKYGSSGYWPAKPVDWNTPAENQDPAHKSDRKC